MAVRIPDELYKVLPPSSTKLERSLTKLPAFDCILDPAIKLLHRAKGDWVGWHYLTDDRDRILLNEHGNPQPVYDGEFYIADGDGNLVVDGDGNYVVNHRFLERFTAANPTFLYWLAIEYGVNYLSEILPNLSDRINGGMELHRVVGTPHAIKLIMRWLLFPDGKVITEREPTIHFPEYQLNLGRYPSLDEVRVLVRSVRFGEPVRSRLRRVMYGWDDPRIILDQSLWDTQNLWDDYSGIRIDDLLNDGHGTTQMKASFRRPMTFPMEPLSIEWIGSHESTPNVPEL